VSTTDLMSIDRGIGEVIATADSDARVCIRLPVLTANGDVLALESMLNATPDSRAAGECVRI
jgi:hypothetical protein